MKTIFSIVSLFGLNTCSLFSQYTPFPNGLAQWNNLSAMTQAGGVELGDWTYLMSGDTMMDGNTYQKMYTSYGPSQIFIGGLRETENRQIYFLPKNLVAIGSFISTFPNTNEEFLLYDFSSHEIGFAIQYPDYSATLLEFDSLEIDGFTYRRYKYENYDAINCALSGPEYWIYEGIGSEFGLFSPYGCQLEVSYYLMCFTAGGSTFENPEIPYTVDNCVSPVQERNEADLILTTFPNPCKDFIGLNFNTPVGGPMDIRILDALGNDVMTLTGLQRSKTKLHIDLSELSAGSYFARVEIQGKTITSRFIKLP